MNSENNNPYIPHIAAVIDSIGEAVHIECGFDPESQLYLAFSRFVNNEMTILDKGTHVPYYRNPVLCIPSRRIPERDATPCR